MESNMSEMHPLNRGNNGADLPRCDALQDSINVLILEDREEDYLLLVAELKSEGLRLNCRQIEHMWELEDALLERNWQLIIADYTFPEFTAIDALALVRATRPEIPFIVVSGSIGEEKAVELMRNGAADYLMKDRLARLALVVKHQLGQSQQQLKHRLLERELQHRQRIEALGTLAGGVAHDFRNALMAIQGYGELLAPHVPAGHPGREDFEQMIEAGQRSQQLVERIMRFARKSEVAPQSINLTRAVEDALALLRPVLPSTIRISFQDRSSCSDCRAISGELEQVIVNLCNNAAQAIGSRPGQITISLDQFTAVEPTAFLTPGCYCRLTVTDDGPGMPPEVLERIFEPFFTTKPPGQGTGLGLATAHMTVTELGGEIKCSSQLGQGTQFVLCMPAMQPEPLLAEPDSRRPALQIMLVDDEPVLANLSTVFLTRAGYQVSQFNDTEAALWAFRTNPEGYDLLFTDFTMPKLNGLELAAELRGLKPNLPVVLCSGYEGTERSVLNRHCDVFIAKPCNSTNVLTAIHQALDMHATGSLAA